jgi:uncharacterized protein YcfJ
MKTQFASALVAISLASSLGLSGAAQAKGCIRGAIAGGVAGHYAGHHGVTGAVAGCLAARHFYKQKAQQETLRKQQQLNPPPQPVQTAPQR